MGGSGSEVVVAVQGLALAAERPRVGRVVGPVLRVGDRVVVALKLRRGQAPLAQGAGVVVAGEHEPAGLVLGLGLAARMFAAPRGLALGAAALVA